MASFGINSVTVSGNLTKDPELRSTPSGTTVTNFSIAHNESRKDGAGGYKDVAHFFEVAVFGGVGEWMARNVPKGTPVVVHGVIQQDRWEKDGQARSKVKILANSVVVPPGLGQNQQQAPQQQQPMYQQPPQQGYPQQGYQQQPQQGYPPQTEFAPPPPPPAPVADEDIPF